MVRHVIDELVLEQARDGYVLVANATRLLGRNSHTLRTWVWRREVPSRYIRGRVFIELRAATLLSASRPNLTARRRDVLE